MRLTNKLLLGSAVGGAALWATRAYLRSIRRIELRDRVVVVTGASSGLGLLVAREAARRGARLAVAARDEADLARAADDLRSSGARDVLAVPTDVSKRDEAERLITRTYEHFGRVDVLINNAGVMTVGPIETQTVEDYERVLAINYWGEVYPTLAVLPIMRRQGFGRIGNVVSIGGLLAVPHMLPYTASKFALTGFTEGLRAEVAKDNILVTGIYPGTIRTGGHRHVDVKGDHEAEYAWFSLSDTVPGLSVSAEACALALWDAVLHGDPQRRVGLQTKLAVGFHDLFPEWFAELMPLVNRALPASPGDVTGSVKGRDIRGVVPNLTNKMVPGGTRPA
jgi:NAD(P)-dependent dehydrogenase (short-subunit alcohol dehydrogenase family)